MTNEIRPEITFASDGEYLAVTRFADKCFKKDENCGYFKSYYPKLYREGNFCGSAHYTIREGGKITALTGSFKNTMKVYGETLRFAGIGTVCVDEEYRGKGYMQLLLNRIVSDAKKEGLDFVFLGGRRQRYELFGITPCGVSASYVFNKDNARHLYGKDVSFGHTFKTVAESDEDVLDRIMSLYTARECRASRERAKIYDTLCSGFNHIEAIFGDGVFKGYLLTDASHRTIVEAEFADVSEMGMILNDYLYAFDVFGAELAFIFPFEKEKNDFLSRHGEGVNIKNCESIRVLNFKKMIKTFMELKSTYCRIADGVLSLGVEGEGRFEISVSDGKACVTDFNGEPEISLPLIDAENLLFGAWKYASDRGVTFPAFAGNWFPLPFFLNRPDFV